MQSLRKKSIISSGSVKQKVTTPMHKISNSAEKGVRRVSVMELMPLSTPVVRQQEQMHEIIKEDNNTFLKLPDTSHSRLSLMLEIIDDTQTSNNDNVLANTNASESNIEKCCITNVRSTSGGASIDSPHPIKNCQIHCNKGHDKIVNG